MARRLLACLPGPSARRHPAPHSRSARGRSLAPGRHQQPRREVAGTPCCQKPHKVYFAAGSAYRASRQERRAGLVPMPRRPPADPLGSRSSTSAPHCALASPLGRAASPRRSAPLARAARPRPQEAPPLPPLLPSPTQLLVSSRRKSASRLSSHTARAAEKGNNSPSQERLDAPRGV